MLLLEDRETVSHGSKVVQDVVHPQNDHDPKCEDMFWTPSSAEAGSEFEGAGQRFRQSPSAYHWLPFFHLRK